MTDFLPPTEKKVHFSVFFKAGSKKTENDPIGGKFLTWRGVDPTTLNQRMG